MVVLFENSSDLRSGRRPVSKFDEFSKSITTVDEIRRCENTTFPIHRYTYWDFESQVGDRAVTCAGLVDDRGARNYVSGLVRTALSDRCDSAGNRKNLRVGS